MNMLTCMQVQKHLQMRIEAQGKYMQSILEKAYQTLTSGDVAACPAAGYKSLGNQAAVLDVCSLKDIGPSVGFPSLQDLHMYGGGHLDLQQQMEQSFFDSSIIAAGSLGKTKRPGGAYGKSPMMWGDDEQGKSDHHHLQMAPPPMMDAGGIDVMDSITDVYGDAKPMMSGDSAGSKGFDGKLERPSPRRPHMGGERNLSYG
uniref:MYB-CC type transcription factor LHEQLE-containing domain-containing protein n=1 Tax=Arundo donax TaxID=35708 RepID=A0A0A9F0J4_ARUDO